MHPLICKTVCVDAYLFVILKRNINVIIQTSNYILWTRSSHSNLGTYCCSLHLCVCCISNISYINFVCSTIKNLKNWIKQDIVSVWNRTLILCWASNIFLSEKYTTVCRWLWFTFLPKYKILIFSLLFQILPWWAVLRMALWMFRYLSQWFKSQMEKISRNLLKMETKVNYWHLYFCQILYYLACGY